MSTIYFDHNATSPVLPVCVARMVEVMTAPPGNPSAKHAAGQAAKRVQEQARGELAAFLGAEPAELVFTSGGTEANHQAILGALALQPMKRHVIASAVEHPSTLALVEHLARQGLRVTRLDVDADGLVAPETLANALNPDTALVSVLWANNETGAIQPLDELAPLVRAHGALFHTDAVQAVGRLPVDVRALPVDLLALSGHKFGAPPGIGALYVRKGLKLPPLLHGHQERRRRAGTPNLPGIAALGAACAWLEPGVATLAGNALALRERLERGLVANVPGAIVNAAGAPRLPNTSSVRFRGVDAEFVLDRLERAGIYASAGSACTSDGTAPSHVLLAMGLDEEQALGTVRFSLGPDNTAEEVDRVVDTLAALLAQRAA
ncbi:MAG: cysteine desulfurase [Gammaproteobacteria bacterium]|nr:cysteine desulfurase [Gammaproteobacteria bacterium]